MQTYYIFATNEYQCEHIECCVFSLKKSYFSALQIRLCAETRRYTHSLYTDTRKDQKGWRKAGDLWVGADNAQNRRPPEFYEAYTYSLLHSDEGLIFWPCQDESRSQIHIHTKVDFNDRVVWYDQREQTFPGTEFLRSTENHYMCFLRARAIIIGSQSHRTCFAIGENTVFYIRVIGVVWVRVSGANAYVCRICEHIYLCMDGEWLRPNSRSDDFAAFFEGLFWVGWSGFQNADILSGVSP